MSERVICIDDSLPKGGYWDVIPVVKGEVYTVRRREFYPEWGHGVYLEEIVNEEDEWDWFGEPGYRAERFAPIRGESIEIFRAIDRKVFGKKRVSA